MIHAMQQIKIPALAISLSKFGNTEFAGIIFLYLIGAMLKAGLLKIGKVVDYLF